VDVSALESILAQQKELKACKEELKKDSEQLKIRIDRLNNDLSEAMVNKDTLQKELDKIVKANEEAKVQQMTYSHYYEKSTSPKRGKSRHRV